MRTNKRISTNKHVGAWLAILLFITVVLAGCASEKQTASEGTAAPTAETKPLKVRYAAFNGVSGLAVRFGAEKGFFKEEGLDVEFISTQDPIAGLTSKEVDIADIATTSAIVAGGKGAPIKIISSMFRTKGPFYLVAGPNIEKIEDLKGKTIGAAAFGSGLDAYVQVILSKHGISKKDVTYVANGVNDAAYASLINGQVDATIIHEPFASMVELSGKGKLLAKGWDYLPNFHTGVLIGHTDFIAKNPQTVEKLLRAYFKSQEYAKSNLEEYKKFFLTQLKLDPQAVNKAFERELVLWENNPDVNKQVLQETQQTQLELGFQDKIYDIDKLLDLRYIPKR